MATTPQQVITNSLIVLGVLFPGQTPPPSLSNDAFTRLNNMLASWSTERLIIYGIETADYDLVTGTNAYTIGPTGAFSGSRPNAIVAAQIVIPSGQRFDLRLITTEEWNKIVDRSATSSVPTVLYDDYEYDNSTLHFWPTPTFNSGTTSVELQIWQPLPVFVTLADTFDLPPGYERAITYNLALELSMVYGRPMTQDAMNVATDSLTKLRALNAPPTHVSGMGEEAVARAQLAQATQSLPTSANPPLQR
jgi:hypothetical protein